MIANWSPVGAASLTDRTTKEALAAAAEALRAAVYHRHSLRGVVIHDEDIRYRVLADRVEACWSPGLDRGILLRGDEPIEGAVMVPTEDTEDPELWGRPRPEIVVESGSGVRRTFRRWGIETDERMWAYVEVSP